jgi:MFS family permease
VKRDYVLLIAWTFVSFWANSMLYPVIPIYVKHMSGDDFLVGLMFALPAFATIATTFFWGMLSDYIGKRKPILIYCGVIVSLLFFIFPYLNAVQLIIARTIQTMFISSSILSFAIVTEYFPHAKGTFIGDLQLFGGVGSTIGGLLVGVLLSSTMLFQGSPELLSFFTLCGLLFLFSTAYLVPINEVKKEPIKRPLKDMFAFGDLEKGRLNQIRNLCLSVAVIYIALLMVYALFPIFVEEEVLESTANATLVVGILSALASAGGMVGSGLAGRLCDRFGRRIVFLVTIVLYIIVIIIYALIRNIYVIAILWSIPLYPFLFVSATAMVSDLTTNVERGRGIGLLNSSMNLGAGFGGLIGGYAARLWDFQFVFGVGLIFVAISLVIALFTKETLERTGT